MSAEVRFNAAKVQYEVKRDDDWSSFVDPQEYATALHVSQKRAERIEQLEAQLAESKRLMRRLADLIADIAAAIQE